MNYSKTLEIPQKHQENFAFVELIAKKFCDVGLRDLAIESGFISVMCVWRMLDGNAYKRAIWFPKLMHETCLRLIPTDFLSD